MSDLISRQAVIDAVNAYLGLSAVSRTIQNMTSIQEILEELPSAEPERKTGEWIYKHCVWFCSECGENPTKGMGYVQGHDELYDFCPKCGSYNRGE